MTIRHFSTDFISYHDWSPRKNVFIFHVRLSWKKNVHIPRNQRQSPFQCRMKMGSRFSLYRRRRRNVKRNNGTYRLWDHRYCIKPVTLMHRGDDDYDSNVSWLWAPRAIIRKHPCSLSYSFGHVRCLQISNVYAATVSPYAPSGRPHFVHSSENVSIFHIVIRTAQPNENNGRCYQYIPRGVYRPVRRSEAL